MSLCVGIFCISVYCVKLVVVAMVSGMLEFQCVRLLIMKCCKKVDRVFNFSLHFIVSRDG